MTGSRHSLLATPAGPLTRPVRAVHRPATSSAPSESRIDRGSISVELVILLPVLLVILGVIMAGGRIWQTRSGLSATAASAARLASQQKNPSLAVSAADDLVRGDLATLAIPCTNLRIVTEASGLAKPAGTAGSVRVDLSCAVPLADLLVPGLPGSITVHGAANHAVDTFREKQR